MSNSHSAKKIKNVTGIRNFSVVFSHVLSKMGILPFHADGFADECEPLPTWQFPSQQKWAEKTRLTRPDKKQEIGYNKKEHSGKWVIISSVPITSTCLNVLFVLAKGSTNDTMHPKFSSVQKGAFCIIWSFIHICNTNQLYLHQ